MTNKILLQIARFLILLLLQVLIVNKVELGTLLQPNIFLLFFLTLPINLKPIPTLLIGFMGGLVLDMFMDSAGFHSTALLLFSFARIHYIRSFTHIDIVESGVTPMMVNMGFRWFITYCLTLVFVYHLAYSFIESFSFRYFVENLVSAAASALLTTVLVILFQLLFFRTGKDT